MPQSPIIDRLNELRRGAGPTPYTLGWLAKEVGVDRSLLYRWLVGERPLTDRRRKQIAAALWMDFDDVVPGTSGEQREAA